MKKLSENYKEKEGKTAALVLNGSYIPYHFSEDFVVFADRAYNRTAFVPDLLVGDFDSFENPEDIDDSVEIVRFPEEKDITDGEGALMEIVSRGYKNVVIYGALGGRQDHIMYNLALLGIAHDAGLNASAISGKQHVYFAGKGVFEAKVKKNCIISVVPFSEKVKVSSTEGLYYKLKDEYLFKKSTRGISNKATSDKISIEIVEGEALIFIINEKNH